MLECLQFLFSDFSASVSKEHRYMNHPPEGVLNPSPSDAGKPRKFVEPVFRRVIDIVHAHDITGHRTKIISEPPPQSEQVD